MYRIRDILPASDLFVVPDTRRVRPFSAGWVCGQSYDITQGREYKPLAGYESPFRDDEACTGPLDVVFLHDIVWDRPQGTIAGERRHPDAVGDGDVTDFEWGEE